MPDNDLQAYVQDEEDDEPVVAYTSSAPPSVKEEANVSRARNKDKLRRDQAGSRSASPSVDQLGDESEADSVTRAGRSPTKRESKRSKESKDKDKARKKEKNEGKRKSVTYEQSRPHTGRAKTTPANLNIQTSPATSRKQPEFQPSPVITTAATSSRPRAYTAQSTARPVSFYGSPGGTISRPPPSNHRFYAQSGTAHPFVPLSPYPPQSPIFFQQPVTAPPYTGHYPHQSAFHAAPFQPPPALGHPQPDYFGQPRPMAPRPEYRRPQSAMGYHQPALSHINHFEDDHEEGGAIVRRTSLKQKPSIRQQQKAEDRKRMPPPPPRDRRPSTTAATRSPFPPPQQNRRSVGSISSIRSIDYTDDEESQWSDPEHHEEYRPHAVRRPNTDSNGYDADYFYDSYIDRHRRNSHHRAQSTERQIEDKYLSRQRDAENYQTRRQGGQSNELTVDRLQEIARTPSHHTKSTASRGNDHDDAQHILIRGTRTLTIGDVSISMDPEDGAEIRIPATMAGGNGTSRGGGSNHSDATYDDRRTEYNGRAEERERERERRTRADRPRSGRETSRAASHSRGLPPPNGYYPSPPTEYGGSVYHHYPQAPGYAPPSGFPYPTRL